MEKTATGKDSLIEQLASFDFTSPVQVNVIFEDEEDENFKHIIKKEIEEECTKSQEKDSKVIKTEQENSEQVKSKYSSPNEYFQINANTTPIENNKDLRHNECSFSSNISSYHNSLKRKSNGESCSDAKVPKKITQDYIEPHNNVLNEQTRDISATMQPNQPYFMNNDSSVKNADSEMTCITNLLKSVSEHLIVILEIHRNYMYKKHSKNINPAEIEKHLDKFLRVKYHFFNLSYCTIENIILPQENNEFFIEKFLNDTIKLAATKNRVLYLETQLIPLFSELLKWAKEKKQQIEKIPIGALNNNVIINQNNTLLKQTLNTPAKPPNQPTQNYNKALNIQASPNVCVQPTNRIDSTKSVVFSTGPPGRQISITVEESLLQSNNNYATNTIAGTQNFRNFNVAQCTNTSFQPQSAATSQTFQNNPYGNHCYMQYMTQQSFLNNAPSYPPPSYPQSSMQHSSPSQYTSARTLSLVPPTKTQCTSHKNSFIDQPLVAQVQPSQIQIEQQNPEITRSISTDSGFMSPVNFNNANETNFIEEGKTSLPTPVITHVTSLNTEAPYIPEGNCYVCRKSTRKMCIGCYTQYYCSYNCQRYDWNSHQITCNRM